MVGRMNPAADASTRCMMGKTTSESSESRLTWTSVTPDVGLTLPQRRCQQGRAGTKPSTLPRSGNERDKSRGRGGRDRRRRSSSEAVLQRRKVLRVKSFHETPGRLVNLDGGVKLQVVM